MENAEREFYLKQIERLTKHAEYLVKANKQWFTPLGQKDPNYPSIIFHPMAGMESVIKEVKGED